jgi:isopentenyl diphosphate isomerase/L-lactate dehydrogenase-like FMN-dependent dehydrogenase
VFGIVPDLGRPQGHERLLGWTDHLERNTKRSREHLHTTLLISSSIMLLKDAEKDADVGVASIIVSNHGISTLVLFSNSQINFLPRRAPSDGAIGSLFALEQIGKIRHAPKNKRFTVLFDSDI